MNSDSITIDFLGDISLAYWDTAVRYSMDITERINEFLGDDTDYRIANLESPIVLDENSRPIDKTGPNLRIDKVFIPFLENLHVDGYTLANNHLGDYGIEGIRDTIGTLNHLKKEYVGIAEEYGELYEPLRKEIRGIRISIFSICENEFGVVHNDRIGAAGYNKSIAKKLIEEESTKADYVIIIFHGGNEHNPFPSPGQKLRYRELVEFGADAVIGMHTHCPQGYEIYCGAPIIYSVGNFFFPKACETPFATWTIGYVARLIFRKEKKTEVQVIPYKFDIYGNHFSAIDQRYFEKYLDEISSVIQSEEYLNSIYKAWASISGKSYFERMCKCVNYLDDRKKLAAVKNIFSCEAHNELVRTYLTLLYENEIEKYSRFVDVIKQYMRYSGEESWNKEVNANALQKADIVIWGIGKKAELLYKEMCSKGKEIVFADKNCLKQGLLFCGKQVVSPQEVISNYGKAEIYICTSKKSALEIQEFLIKNHMIWKENAK